MTYTPEGERHALLLGSANGNNTELQAFPDGLAIQLLRLAAACGQLEDAPNALALCLLPAHSYSKASQGESKMRLWKPWGLYLSM